MTLQKLPGGEIALPSHRNFDRAVSGFALAGIALDSTSEQAIFTGRFIWSDGGTHTVSGSGGKIGWRTGGGQVFSASGSQLTVGIQDPSSSAGPPSRGDGTWDVKKVLNQGTDTIASSTFYQTAMDTGSKTIATNDEICIIIEFTTRNGSDTINPTNVSASVRSNSPSIVNFVSPSTYTGLAHVPNVYLIADDGTFGTLEGAFVFNTVGTNLTAWNNTSTTKEYGNLFSLPFACRISGIWCVYSNNNGTGSAELRLYTDPLNTGAGVTQAGYAPVTSRIGAELNSTYLSLFPLATPYDYTANTLMAMAVAPTSATSINAGYFEVDSNAAWALHPLGTQCYSVSRNTVSSGTAFSTFGSDARRMMMGLLISHFDDGAGGGGTLVVPNISRNIFLGGEL